MNHFFIFALFLGVSLATAWGAGENEYVVEIPIKVTDDFRLIPPTDTVKIDLRSPATPLTIIRLIAATPSGEVAVAPFLAGVREGRYRIAEFTRGFVPGHSLPWRATHATVPAEGTIYILPQIAVGSIVYEIRAAMETFNQMRAGEILEREIDLQTRLAELEGFTVRIFSRLRGLPGPIPDPRNEGHDYATGVYFDHAREQFPCEMLRLDILFRNRELVLRAHRFEMQKLAHAAGHRWASEFVERYPAAARYFRTETDERYQKQIFVGFDDSDIAKWHGYDPEKLRRARSDPRGYTLMDDEILREWLTQVPLPENSPLEPPTRDELRCRVALIHP